LSSPDSLTIAHELAEACSDPATSASAIGEHGRKRGSLPCPRQLDLGYGFLMCRRFSTCAFLSWRVASNQAISCSSDQSAIWQQL
jgi:hypothetical protein